MNTFIESLSNENAKSIKHIQASAKFRFGDGEVYDSIDCVELPVYVGRKRVTLTTHVVPCDIPLLLSRESMKKAGCQLDFMNDRVTLFDEKLSLKISKSGHYCMPLLQYCTSSQSVNGLRNHIQNVMFSAPSFSTDNDKCIRQIRKLHRQFAHPIPGKLKKLLRDAGVDDKVLMALVDNVSRECDVCKRFKRPPLRPIVSFPLANDFNETVAMDIKVIDSKLVLHMIDHVTRYSSACVLRNKRKETIVQALMEYWVRIFGAPTYILTDNGGEFVNDEVVEYAEKFNIQLRTTAAESAWSNGLCERHNASLANNVYKTMHDAQCSLEMAVHWSVAAKNALSNVYGFSPNQLVFGRNTNLPSALHNRLPAQNPTCRSRYIAQNLAALHKARESFIQQEACEKLKRALSHQTRTYADIVYKNGDKVYYKRESSHEWHGPAKIIGRDDQRYLLKHGGTYHRVHPCKMQHVTDGNHNMTLPETQSSATQTPGSRVDKQAPTRDQGAMVESEEDDDSSCTPDAKTVFMTPPPTPQHEHHDPPGLNSPRAAEQVVNQSPVPVNNEVSQSDDGNIADVLPFAETPPQPNFRTPPSEELHYDGSPPRAEKPPDSPSRVPRALARLQHHNKPGTSEQVLHATSSTSPRFDQAKQEEMQKWIDMGTYVEVCDSGQPRISTRWVCTEKVKGNDIILKARLVARGFEENTNELRKDSPTCQKESLRCFLSVLASHQWKLCSIDIKSAYLQGIPINRELYIQPPKEAQTDKIWHLKKCPYGLADAGRHWHIRVKEELLQLGGQPLALDQSVFVWHEDGICVGVMVIHVDDFIYGGTDTFQERVVCRFRKVFQVGSEESVSMKYIGVLISQSAVGIHISTDTYCQDLLEIDTTSLGGDQSRTLCPEEVTRLKQVSGQINWAVNQSRPDCAFDNCIVANSTKNATVANIHRANKAIRKVRGQSVHLLFPSDLDLPTCRIIAFSDASHANLPDKGSQGAYIVFLIDEAGRHALLSWHSRRIKRVVNSTLAAECLAAVEASDASIALSVLLSSMLGCPKFPISVLVDNKSLVDNVHSSTAVENKRLQIDVGILRDDLNQKSIHELRWIETSLQVANCLTKNGCSSQYLLDIIRLRKRFDFNTGTFV